MTTETTGTMEKLLTECRAHVEGHAPGCVCRICAVLAWVDVQPAASRASPEAPEPRSHYTAKTRLARWYEAAIRQAIRECNCCNYGETQKPCGRCEQLVLALRGEGLDGVPDLVETRFRRASPEEGRLREELRAQWESMETVCGAAWNLLDEIERSDEVNVFDDQPKILRLRSALVAFRDKAFLRAPPLGDPGAREPCPDCLGLKGSIVGVFSDRRVVLCLHCAGTGRAPASSKEGGR